MSTARSGRVSLDLAQARDLALRALAGTGYDPAQAAVLAGRAYGRAGSPDSHHRGTETQSGGQEREA